MSSRWLSLQALFTFACITGRSLTRQHFFAGQEQHVLFQDVYVRHDLLESGGEGGEVSATRNWKKRRALLVVGLGPSLLCLLLQPESKDLHAEQ